MDISNAEWKIMQMLWENGAPMTSAEVVACLKDGRSPKTLKTLLQRLVAKGFVSFTADAADSRAYRYFPALSEDECVRKENKDFVSLYYKGDVGGMLARFIGDSKLDDKQIDELSALLNAKKEDGV